MQLIRGLNKIPEPWSGCIATIGNFDGVHLGHQAIFQRLRQLKQTYHLPIVAMIFEPHPREFFSIATAPPRLSSLRDKCLLLKQQGVDVVICVRFTESFCQMSAREFIDKVLVNHLQIKHVIMGEDFRFGHQRKGDFSFLAKRGLQMGFVVERCQSRQYDDRIISSTRIRQCLLDGEFAQVNAMLGRPYQISGRVAKGEQRGREWGFPTINLRWPFHQPTLHGIYAVNVLGLADEAIPGAASVGCRPTVDGSGWNIEVHLLDYAQDCYGKAVTVQFLKWFREEVCFDSVEALKQQIATDVDNIRGYFNVVAATAAVKEVQSL